MLTNPKPTLALESQPISISSSNSPPPACAAANFYFQPCRHFGPRGSSSPEVLLYLLLQSVEFPAPFVISLSPLQSQKALSHSQPPPPRVLALFSFRRGMLSSSPIMERGMRGNSHDSFVSWFTDTCQS